MSIGFEEYGSNYIDKNKAILISFNYPLKEEMGVKQIWSYKIVGQPLFIDYTMLIDLLRYWDSVYWI